MPLRHHRQFVGGLFCGLSVLWASLAANAGDVRPLESASAASPDAETEFVRRRNEQIKRLPPVAAPPQVSAPTFNGIDQFIVAGWTKAGLISAGQTPVECDDATFARRVYLDLTGAVPTIVELNQFLVDSSGGKRRKLVDHLLTRQDDYAAHWTPFWEDALASQTVLAQGGIPTRGNYRDWILQSFERNRPFDVMVAELLDPAMPGRKTAIRQDIFGVPYTIEFVRNEDHTQPLQTAANVGQVFLGAAMKCASCHDSFDRPEWTQDRFLGFAGLFAPHDLERIRCESHSGHYVPARFPFTVPGRNNDCPKMPPCDCTTLPAGSPIRTTRGLPARLSIGCGSAISVVDYWNRPTISAMTRRPAIRNCSTGWPTISSGMATTCNTPSG